MTSKNDSEWAQPDKPVERQRATVRVLDLDTPDASGDVFRPGCIREAVEVPICRDFDFTKPMGMAKVYPDGLAVVELAEPVDLDAASFSIGYTVAISTFDQRKRDITSLRVICVGYHRQPPKVAP